MFVCFVVAYRYRQQKTAKARERTVAELMLLTNREARILRSGPIGWHRRLSFVRVRWRSRITGWRVFQKHVGMRRLRLPPKTSASRWHEKLKGFCFIVFFSPPPPLYPLAVVFHPTAEEQTEIEGVAAVM